MITYKDAGVDIEKARHTLGHISRVVKETFDENVLGDIGGFGGFYQLGDQILVSGTDGVGTKILLAKEMGNLKGLGYDLVAMCVNDIICHGAKPLFFLDYYATGKLKEDELATIVESIASACSETKCALIGGETAEMPGVYEKDDFDLAGFAVGVVHKDRLITGNTVDDTYALVGMKSSGFHSNGYSLVRKILKEVPKLKHKYGQELIKPTLLYYPVIEKLLEKYHLGGISHITGGGFYENIPRSLPKGYGFRIEGYEPGEMFEDFVFAAGLNKKEAYSTFNMGVGMVITVKKEEKESVMKDIELWGYAPVDLGDVVKAEESIVL